MALLVAAASHPPASYFILSRDSLHRSLLLSTREVKCPVARVRYSTFGIDQSNDDGSVNACSPYSKTHLPAAISPSEGDDRVQMRRKRHFIGTDARLPSGRPSASQGPACAGSGESI